MTSIKTADIEYRCPALELIADPGSEYWARAHAADVLRAWRLEHLSGLVDPLIGEMVLNRVRHSSSHIAVILRAVGGSFVIDVWDAGLRVRDELPLTKSLADKFEVVAAERGGRLVRASILVRDEKPTDDVITRVIDGLRALNDATRASTIPAEDGPRRFAREG
jgi:anti-sigma regulatory factor (Ser/Thr protein kinase)